MRIAVTGASGRLGRSVVAVLRESGHEVHALDRVASDDLNSHAIELTDAPAVQALFLAIAPDAVIHLAAIAVPFSRPEREIFTTNTSMAFIVLEAAVAADIPRVLVASSPTVLGYGRASWKPSKLPLDETISTEPSNAYALSKVCIEEMVASFARSTSAVRFATFRPCYVISPEEWEGAPTQQGHTIVERLQNPALSAVALFNYVDARDAGEFVNAWVTSDGAPSGACYFVGAQDALAVGSLDDLLPQFHPACTGLADVLAGQAPAFDSTAAARDTGWIARRSWRTELAPHIVATLVAHQPVLDRRTL